MNGEHMHRSHRPSAEGLAGWSDRPDVQERAADREARPDLYDALVRADCQIDHHESDLYVRNTERARGVIAGAGYSMSECQPFVSQLDGGTWLDFPFRYSPFWRARQIPLAAAFANLPAPFPTCHDCGERHDPEELCEDTQELDDQEQVPDCTVCFDGNVVSDTCDHCGERHCWKCDPCTPNTARTDGSGARGGARGADRPVPELPGRHEGRWTGAPTPMSDDDKVPAINPDKLPENCPNCDADWTQEGRNLRQWGTVGARWGGWRDEEGNWVDDDAGADMEYDSSAVDTYYCSACSQFWDSSTGEPQE